ncbi:cytochrome P450 [Trametes polyzona]|nr:cytochrome P450 [Trametes polyzona]
MATIIPTSSKPVMAPGPQFILDHWHYLVLPPALPFLVAYAGRRFFDVSIPLWVLIPSAFLSIPLVALAVVKWNDYNWARRAAAHGAVMPVVAKRDGIPIPKDNTRFPRDVFFRLSEKYGHTFLIELYNMKRAILATDFASYEKGPNFRYQMQTLLGIGVFNADDLTSTVVLCRFHRSMTRPFFSKDRISHFDIFDRHALDALSQMKTRMKEGYAVDWQDLVSRFTLDSATEFLFGKDVRSLSAGLPYPPTSEIARLQTSKPEADEFAEAFLRAQITSSKRGRYQALWGLTEFFHDKVQPQKAAIDKFISPILVAALQRKAEMGSDPESKATEEDTLLSQLLKVTDDYNLIHDETLNILLAGRDTTACTLTFAVYRLAEHPDVLKRLRQEVLDIVGPTRRPTYEDVRNMKYLRAVINETLRLYPPVCAVKDTFLPSRTGERIFVPKGTRCIYSIFNMHRRKDLWGPDALKFDPDRFLDERVQKYLTPNPFIFLPFNAGPRICLGQQFAYNEASFMLIRLMQQVSAIEFVPEVAPESIVPPDYTDSPGSDGTDRVFIASHLTTYAKGGLWVRMTEAQAEEE